MFSKKKCEKCGEKFSERFNFCPNCGFSSSINEDSDDWGILGKSDLKQEKNPFDEIKLPVGFNMLFNSLMNNLNKQFSEMNQQAENELRKNIINTNKNGNIGRGISIKISTSGNRPPEIVVGSFGENKKITPKKQLVRENSSHIPKGDFKKFSTLPREEPQTNIRRFGNRVIYEIEMPEVKSIEDVSIIKLESSIEIKAISDNKAYSKIIPINLPIRKYGLSDGKLVLELQGD